MSVQQAIDFIKEKTIPELVSLGFNITEDAELMMISFTDKTNLECKVARQLNGIILEKKTMKLVHHCFAKAYEGFDFQGVVDSYEEALDDNYSIHLLTEGSMIRVFWYNNEWRIGTSRKIDAVYSHWGSDKSFKELFLETLELPENNIHLQNLDKECCHTFLLQHPDVKLGLDIEMACIIPLNKINLETLVETKLDTCFRTKLRMPELLTKNLKLSENYMVICDDGTRIKFLNPEYAYVRKILNNNPSLKWGYLEAIQKQVWHVMRYYFQSKRTLFDNIDVKIVVACTNIQQEYYNKYILKNKDYKWNKKYERTLIQLHARYLKTRNKTNPQVIQEHLLGLKTPTLFWILDL